MVGAGAATIVVLEVADLESAWSATAGNASGLQNLL